MPSHLYRKHVPMLWDRQKGLCAICKSGMSADPLGDYGATVDHKLPQALGGKHRVGNLRLVHKKCNQERGARMLNNEPMPNRVPAAQLIAAAYRRHNGE